MYSGVKSAIHRIIQDANSLLAQVDALEMREQQLRREQESLEGLLRVKGSSVPNHVKLNVGGEIIKTSVDTLTNEKHTYFSVLLSEAVNKAPDADGEYFIDRDGGNMRIILNYLRGNDMLALMKGMDQVQRDLLRQDVEYYGIESLLSLLDGLQRERQWQHHLNHHLQNLEQQLQQKKKQLRLHQQQQQQKQQQKQQPALVTPHKSYEDIQHSEDPVQNIAALLGYYNDMVQRKEEDITALKSEIESTKQQTDMLLTRVRDDWNKTKIKLDVGGRQFATTKETLLRVKNTFFSGQLTGNFDAMDQEKDGSYFIDRDPTHFPIILNHLRGVDMRATIRSLSSAKRVEILHEMDFYILEELKELILGKRMHD